LSANPNNLRFWRKESHGAAMFLGFPVWTHTNKRRIGSPSNTQTMKTKTKKEPHFVFYKNTDDSESEWEFEGEFPSFQAAEKYVAEESKKYSQDKSLMEDNTWRFDILKVVKTSKFTMKISINRDLVVEE
jgi:hypothetical protein